MAQNCVRRALDEVKAALIRDPTTFIRLSHVAGAIGVSPRTLQRHFARVLGLPLHAVIQRSRLEAARQSLQAGDAQSVLDVTLRHGFGHPGRFASIYADAFGEPPSATLRSARAVAPATTLASGKSIVLRALEPVTSEDAARARRATEDLAIALSRTRGLVLLRVEDAAASHQVRELRLEGRVDADCAVLTLVQPQRKIVLMIREPFRTVRGIGWANRAVAAVREAIAADTVEQARRKPRHRTDVETLVTRARPAALTQEPEMIRMAVDLLDESLHRDPAHAAAHALAGWSRALNANHCLTRDPDDDRARAVEHCRRALALSPDDPEVLTLAAGICSLTCRFDEAEDLVQRSLALDPHQPEALRRLGFIQNFRGNGRRAATAFRRALQTYPSGNNKSMSLIGLGVANFICGDYGRSARALSRGLDLQPSRAWPHRFLTAAAMHAGATEVAQRSLTALMRHFPDLTVDRCAQSDALHAEARGRVLSGLARAGLPR